MIRLLKVVALAVFCAAAAYGATDATISGVVKDPSGAPFRGAFVRAQNQQSKISVNVLTDAQGLYRIKNLAPGEYQLRVTATGFKTDPRSGVKLGAGDDASLDFALQQGTVRWSDLSLYQGKTLMPEGKGKEILTGQCFCVPRFPDAHGGRDARP